MSEVITVAKGLRFPEGPIAMADGSIILVEIERGTLTRVSADGEVSVIAELGGGPNGAALGPDGKCYVCNNGGFEWHHRNGKIYPGEQPENYSGGRIERVDLVTGEVETLFTESGGVSLRGPNDIVFDRTGGFWFTDHGKVRARDQDRTGVFYVTSEGEIHEVIFPLNGPNGIGLSPDEDELYVAETTTGRCWAFPLSSPGELDINEPRRPLNGPPGYYFLDSLAVDAEGGVAVATILNGGITTYYPDDRPPKFFPTSDRLTTNICFGGEDLRTAYITLSSTGALIKTHWHTAGLKLNYQA